MTGLAIDKRALRIPFALIVAVGLACGLTSCRSTRVHERSVTAAGARVDAVRVDGSIDGLNPDRLNPKATTKPEVESERRRVVVLIHGLFRTTQSMRPLHRSLEGVGFEPYPYRYFSTRGTVEAHGEKFAAKLAELEADPTVESIHVVTHSLGGPVTRAALTHGRPTKLQRVVMLAPPNRGSRVATRFAPYFGALIRPLSELSHDRKKRKGSKLLDRPATPGVEIGVIAGSRDRTVDMEYTHVDGESDHTVVDSGHTFIMNKRATQRQVVHFLLTGRFNDSSGNKTR